MDAQTEWEQLVWHGWMKVKCVEKYSGVFYISLRFRQWIQINWKNPFRETPNKTCWPLSCVLIKDKNKNLLPCLFLPTVASWVWATACLPSNKDTGGPWTTRNNILFVSTVFIDEWTWLCTCDQIKTVVSTWFYWLEFEQLKAPPRFGNSFLPRQSQTDFAKDKHEYLEGLRRLTKDHLLIWIFTDSLQGTSVGCFGW